jgi:hypothetical protein
MEMNQVSLYVSPRSGFTYEIVPTDQYGWFRYDVRKDGQSVQFALTEDGVAGSVARYEGVSDGWVTSPRD